MLYARSTEDKQNKNSWQTLPDHLNGVAKRAEEFANSFGAGSWGKVAGLLHDIGKASDDFQKRLEGGRVVDHATAGAKEAQKHYRKDFAIMLGYIICGHHGGIPTGGYSGDDAFLFSRIEKDVPDYSTWRKYLPEPLPKQEELRFSLKLSKSCYGFQIAFYIRMLYSCLVDADVLDAEEAVNEKSSRLRSRWPSLDSVQDRLTNFLLDQQKNAPMTPINKRRSQIRDYVTNSAVKDKGLFSLTVPTGGGKTQISLDFAMKHAKHHNLERIIYVIPYTSIIEQNAQVFRNILGNEIVLEHHSNVAVEVVSPTEKGQDDGITFREKCKLASENWDASLIVTTSVQALESLFANKSSKCRKLHRLSNSILIFDEAQMIPNKFLQPALVALNELVKNYGSTVILCTATQPAWDKVRSYGQKEDADLLEDQWIQELAPEPQKLYEEFRRVKAQYLGEQSDLELIERFCKEEQVLCIVNTRRHAQNLFALLKKELPSGGGLYHLSTRMCPLHRREKLAEIRQRLSEGLSCRVISTQLIEAGVDVDFPKVYRSLAGIDSVVQAAGRCNREQKRREGEVFVFRPKNKKDLPAGYFSRTGTIAEKIFNEFSDPLSLEAIEKYFRELYAMDGKNSLDDKEILRSLQESVSELSFDFPKVAEDFRLIDSVTENIIVPWTSFFKDLKGTSSFFDYLAAVEKMIDFEFSSVQLNRNLQPITLQVYEHELKLLAERGLARLYYDREEKNGYWVLVDEDAYDLEQGLTLKDPTDAPVYIF